MHIDFLLPLLVLVTLFGTLGWLVTIPFGNCLLWYFDWKDGTTVDWGANIGYALAGPAGFFYVIFVLYTLYF